MSRRVPQIGAGALVTVAALALACVPASARTGPRLIAPSAVISGRASHPAGARAHSPVKRRRTVPLRVLDRPAYERAKRAAAARAGQRSPAGAGGATPSTAAPGAHDAIASAVFGSLNQAGLSAAAQIEATGLNLTPPDSTGAIGPNDYVEMVNSEVAAYARSSLTLAAGPVSLEQFTGGTEMCDPQIKYDPQSGRWFYAAIRCDLKENETLYLGFSKSSDPSDFSTAPGGGWCGYEYDTAQVLEDYPKLGLDPQHIIIGTNSFEAASEEFVTSHILSAPKPPGGTIESCPPAPALTVFGSAAEPLTTSTGNYAFTPEPASVADGSAAGYVVAADFEAPRYSRGSHIMVWKVGGTADQPQLQALGAASVAPYEVPPPVPQPGTNDTIDSLDGRLTQALAAADPNAAGEEAVWTQHTVAGGAGSVVRWYELLPGRLAEGAAVRQSGTVSDPSRYVFNAAIAPTLSGNAVIDYNTGSASAPVDIVAQSRLGSDPLGTMSGPVVLGSSSAIDSDYSCTAESCRWGDYAGASVDPVDEQLVWGSNQLNGPGTNQDAQWATRNFALSVRATQTITFTSTAPSSASVGGPPYSVAASASSGLPVSFSSVSPAVCSVSGFLVSFIAAGECAIEADQAGDETYEPAPAQQQRFPVGKGSQSITFTSPAPASATVGGPAYTVSATGGPSGNAVTFTIDTASRSVCAISGATVSFTAVGMCSIDADQAGDANYGAAPRAQQSFPVVAPLTAPLASPLTPGSGFRVLRVRIDRLTGALIFRLSVPSRGKLSWRLTFRNGSFGVFAASAAKCPPGQRRLNGTCRPSRIIYAKGGRSVARSGIVSFTAQPSRAARRALKRASKRGERLRVRARITFRSALGGAPVSRTKSMKVSLSRRS